MDQSVQQSEDRYYWEKRIMEAGRHVVAAEAGNERATVRAFEAYLETWLDLKRVYERSIDSVIGAEVVLLLIGTTRWLRVISIDSSLPESVRSAMLEQLEELETTVELVMWEAASNVNNANLG